MYVFIIAYVVSCGFFFVVFWPDKLKGLHENSIVCCVSKSCLDKGIPSRVYEIANVMKVTCTKDDEILRLVSANISHFEYSIAKLHDKNTWFVRFAGQSMSSKSLVLLTIKVLDNAKANVTVNCEKIVIGSMLLKEVKTALGKWNKLFH